MSKLYSLRILGAAVCCALFAVAVQAQPSTGGPTPGSPPPTSVPIDGGITLLLAAGGAYGLKRLRNRRAKK